MHHFFLPPTSIQGPTVIFPVETAHQIQAVLRLRAGQHVIALDNLGSEFEVELTKVERSGVSGSVVEQRPSGGEPPVHLALYLCLAQREKFEWMLQKCTEVGACEFIPVISSRSLVQERMEGKQERWERILREAAEQSHRGRVPVLRPALRYEAALAEAARHPCRLIPREQEYTLDLRTALHPTGASAGVRLTSAAVLIGPEGGFSEAEVKAARTAGFLPITLGPRILRMETAAVVAAALVLHELS